jgi:rfaE bifunctional protein nucleotidyltransferase chain/domain
MRLTDTDAVTHTDRKIAPSAGAASSALAGARAEGKRVVLTNGVFDLLHAGHVRYLQEARAQGDLLVVGLNGDDSVRRRKGPSRPLMPLEDRMVVVAALASVDLVVPFHEDTANELVAHLQPDVYVKGGDYDPAAPPGSKGHLPEAAVCRDYGGQVAVLSFLPGRSTTDLVRRINERREA